MSTLPSEDAFATNIGFIESPCIGSHASVNTRRNEVA